MTTFDRRRLPPSVFKLDVERMRRGWYSDKYFINIARTLSHLAAQGYRFGGSAPDLSDLDVDVRNVDVGSIEVEMQWFPRRQPSCVVVGVDKALAMLRECTGFFDESGRFVNTFEQMEVWAVHDGTEAPFEGDVLSVTPVMKVRGRYRDFAILETPTLGTLTRGSRVATNVYEVLKAARGKQVLFFPARFDAHEVQAADGYAYQVAVQLFNQNFGKSLSAYVSTDAQGDWWGGAGGGTVAHAAIASFMGDTAEAMMQFARILPARIPRIALVDFNNDSVRDTLRVLEVMFRKYQELCDLGDEAEAAKYVLYGVRLDTGGNLRDVSVAPLGDPALDLGVNPRLVFNVRQGLDSASESWSIPPAWKEAARQYCRNVKIVVSGGFGPEKIRKFERLGVPVDIYAVGSWLFNNNGGTVTDFTGDVVRVKVHGEWIDMAKVGRKPLDNPNLERAW